MIITIITAMRGTRITIITVRIITAIMFMTVKDMLPRLSTAILLH